MITLAFALLPMSLYSDQHPHSAYLFLSSSSFSREIPTRFKKQILAPYVGSNGAVEIDQLNRLLMNIGHNEDCLSFDEQNELLKAAGCTSRSISVTKLSELMD
jgi:hypothetical protein